MSDSAVSICVLKDILIDPDFESVCPTLTEDEFSLLEQNILSDGEVTNPLIIAAGGWVAVVVIVVICLIALIVCSCFGIFFSSEDKNDGSQTMREVVIEINQDYQNQLDTIKANNPYDDLEMSGSRAV